ncbi:MAG: polysaccharide deacetylase family protein [Deltaproteobacteria bacterium]|nr:polysaccharide deacetylase family protein [Deltaproteobacteria bacterium]
MKFACISIDFDEITEYQAIHGIEASKTQLSVTQNCIENVRRLIYEENIPVTTFLTSQSLDYAYEGLKLEYSTGLTEAGNHSLNHRYDLGRLDYETIKKEIFGLHEQADSKGLKIKGFRSPGWHLSRNILKVIEELNYSYTSCMNPSTVYYLSKLLYIGFSFLKGVETSSVIHPPSDLLVHRPYFPDNKKPWKNSSKGKIVEIPMSTGSFPFILPFTGYFLFKFKKPSFFIPLTNDFAVFHLHGVDFLNENTREGQYLRGYEKVLGLPFAERFEILKRVINNLKSRGYVFMTLGNIEKEFRKTEK